MGLSRKDSHLGNYIKTNELDKQNNFVWDREIATLFLSLKSARNTLPVEFSENLSIYPIEVVDEFVNHALDRVYSASKTNRDNKDVTEFVLELSKLQDAGYFNGSPLSLQVQEKIELLKTRNTKNP